MRKTPTVLVGVSLTAVTDTVGWVGAMTRRAGSCVRSPFVAPNHDLGAAP